MAETLLVESIILLIAVITAACFARLYFKNRKGSVEGEQAALSFTTLTQVAPAGIWRTDANGFCTYVNRYWEEITGFDRERWYGTGWADALHPDDRDRVFANFMQTVSREELFEDEWRFLCPQGSSLWVKSMGSPEYDENGTLIGYVGINLDIQRSKELQKDLNKALEKAEQAAAAKATFLANMSHEIRTPMNGVIGFTDMLLESELTDEQFTHVQMISDSGRAMMRLLNDILDVSKIESGQLRIINEPTDLRQKLRHCAKLHEPMARSKGLELSTFVDDAVPETLMLDRLRVRQVLLNLIGNAVKFTDHGGVDVEARVENSTDGKVLLLSVIDTGIGIESDKLATIFNPFTQEDGSVARRYGGTGLGLAISSQLATMMDGRITVHSKPGVGTNFTVRLPLVEAANGNTKVEIEEPGRGALAEIRGAHVLVAEDHAINQRLILAMLSSIGIDAKLAEDGEAAVAAVVEADKAGNPFDVVLMDMQMPDVDGLEATRRLRKLGYGPKSLPIIALTANCYPDDIAACTSAGMQSHLGKPVTTVALARELARWLSPADKAGTEHFRSASTGHAVSKLTCPSLAGLEAKYRDRKGALVDSLRSSIEADPGQTDWEALARELHKMAGVAANFGDPELGEASRRLEQQLISTAEPHLRKAALKREWPLFEEAA